MSSLFSNLPLWRGDHWYVTAHADFLHHQIDPAHLNVGTTCLMTCSSSLFRRLLELVPPVDDGTLWPYSTTPLRVCQTVTGKRFAVHFPAFGLGLGGTPQDHVQIGDILVIEGAVRGDGVSRYYAPLEYPAIADLSLTAQVRAQLEQHGERYLSGLSFGTDALYREDEQLMSLLRALGVLSVDLESSALLTVGRRLGVACCWVGVVSDRLVTSTHEGTIHPDQVMSTLLRLAHYLIEIMTQGET